MKSLLLIIILFLFVFQASAQKSDSIIYKNRKFYQRDVPLSMKTLKEIVRPVPLAYQEVKSGRSRITWGYIAGMFGAISFGGGAGTLIAGGSGEGEGELDPLTGMGVGAVAMGVGILLVKSGAKRFAHGIDLFNSSISSNSVAKKPEINFGFSNRGFALMVRF
jgi:hypothetical protein